MANVTQSDIDQVMEHIHSIFRAYISKDRKTIRDLHAPDWIGFQGPSRQIERGIDAYMRNADKSLEHLTGIGFAILDTEIQTADNLILVYYVARYDYADETGETKSLPLRSIDVYRKIDGQWNQIGSHIGVIPGGENW